jgi:hypothetical protein
VRVWLRVCTTLHVAVSLSVDCSMHCPVALTAHVVCQGSLAHYSFLLTPPLHCLAACAPPLNSGPGTVQLGRLAAHASGGGRRRAGALIEDQGSHRQARLSRVDA